MGRKRLCLVVLAGAIASVLAAGAPIEDGLELATDTVGNSAPSLMQSDPGYRVVCCGDRGHEFFSPCETGAEKEKKSWDAYQEHSRETHIPRNKYRTTGDPGCKLTCSK